VTVTEKERMYVELFARELILLHDGTSVSVMDLSCHEVIFRQF